MLEEKERGEMGWASWMDGLFGNVPPTPVCVCLADKHPFSPPGIQIPTWERSAGAEGTTQGPENIAGTLVTNPGSCRGEWDWTAESVVKPQHHLGWKRCPIWSRPPINPEPQWSWLNHSPQMCHTHKPFERFQTWWFHHKIKKNAFKTQLFPLLSSFLAQFLQGKTMRNQTEKKP